MSPISNASRLAEFGSGIGTDGAVLQVDNADKRIGIGTTNPQAMLQVGTGVSVYGNVGIVSATEVRADTLRGDGTNITGVVGVGTLNVRTNTLTSSGIVTITNTTDSTSTGTGALIISGGVGIAKSLHVGQNITIGGTLTYEDVTNIDSLGIVTARAGVNVSGGQLTVGTGITMGIAGVSTFSKSSTYAGLNLRDNVKITFGEVHSSSDLEMFSDGTEGIIDCNVANLKIKTSTSTSLLVNHSENALVCTHDGSVDAYYANSKKWETTNDGTVTTGVCTATDFSGASGGAADFPNGLTGTTGTFTGDVDIADKIVHSGDTNTSIRFPAADTVTVETSGSERARIDSSGRLLLGTATANSSDRFTIVDPGNAFISLRSDAEADGNSQIIDFAIGTGDRSSSNLVSSITSAIPTGAAAGGTLKGYLAFSTNSGDSLSERLRLDSSGRLLLGTTTEGFSSGDDLTIATSSHTGITIRSGTTSEGAVYFSDATSGAGEYIGSLVYSHNTNAMVFTTNGSERLRIKETGETNIGTGSTTIAKFCLTGASNGAHQIIGQASNNVAALDVYSQHGSDGNKLSFAVSDNRTGSKSNAFVVKGSGYAGINTDNPQRYLHIVGNDGATGATSGNSDTQLVIDNKGTNGSIIEFLNDTNGSGYLLWTDTAASNRGLLQYNHSTNAMTFGTNAGTTALTLDSSQNATFAAQVTIGGGLYVVGEVGLFNGSTNASRYIDAGLGDNNTLFIRGCSGGDANHETLAQFTRNGACTLFHDASARIATTAAGVTVTGTVSDSIGDVRSIPLQNESSAHTPNASSAGYVIYISTGGVTLNNSVFSSGDVLTIINNSGSDQTITQGSGLNLYNSADASSGNRTLAGRGMCTVWFAAANVAYMSGAGLS